MQNHYISGDISKLKERRAYWAIKPNGTVVIFVHGLMGEAVGAWSDFERMLLSTPKGAGCDLIFYKYNSTDAQTGASSRMLYNYLKALLTKPAAIVNKDLMLTDRRAANFEYKKVILVAHSLGSIICRQALLQASKSKDNWADLVQLILFAPAHLGATDIGGFASAVAAVFKANFVVSAAELKWPVLKELQQGSDTLKKLSHRTKKALVGGKAQFLRAKKVVFGELDGVVIIDDFCDDAPYDIFDGKGHRDVCKPKDSFRSPLEAVLEFL